MPTIQYVEKRFSEATLAVIDRANEIIEEYAEQGFDLTLRQLYYQFVSRGLLENSEPSYKRLGNIISDGRLAGLIDWERIVDRTRSLKHLSHWDNPGEIIKSAAYSYRIDKWERQPYRIQVWVEKDALIGVFQGVCDELDLPYFACRGYTSQTEMWNAAQRLIGYAEQQNVIILHFGDHDPSGIDMTRDIVDRLTLFTGDEVKVHRLALNIDQVHQYTPPPNPTKLTDSRANSYIDLYGMECWELDAMQPAVLAGLVRDTVALFRNEDIWQEDLEREATERKKLNRAAKDWAKISEGL